MIGRVEHGRRTHKTQKYHTQIEIAIEQTQFRFDNIARWQNLYQITCTR